MGMINDITTVISGSMGMDMKSMSIESNNGVFNGNINLEVKNRRSLEETFKKLKVINGVSRVRRYNLSMNLTLYFKKFFNNSQASGIILIFCVLISLLIANSALAESFQLFLDKKVGTSFFIWNTR
jgi:hypothetical protein